MTGLVFTGSDQFFYWVDGVSKGNILQGRAAKRSHCQRAVVKFWQAYNDYVNNRLRNSSSCGPNPASSHRTISRNVWHYDLVSLDFTASYCVKLFSYKFGRALLY